MSGDDLLQPLETIVDGRLVQGCAEEKRKRRTFRTLMFHSGNKLIERKKKSLRTRVNSYSEESHFGIPNFREVSRVR